MLGFGTLTKKIFGSANDRKVKAARPLVEKINALEPEFEVLSDEELIAKTREFAERANNGESLMICCQRHLPTVVKPLSAHWAFAPLMCSCWVGYSYTKATSQK